MFKKIISLAVLLILTGTLGGCAFLISGLIFGDDGGGGPSIQSDDSHLFRGHDKGESKRHADDWIGPILGG